MDDDLFKGALGLDSDEDDAGLPAGQPAEADPAAQHLQAAGLDSDEDQDMKSPVDPVKMDVKEELPQTPPAPGSPAEDAGGLKGATQTRVHLTSTADWHLLVNTLRHPDICAVYTTETFEISLIS